MNVVLLHDWLTGFRGGERVLEALCEMYPNAPIYTLIHKKGSCGPVIESREIRTSFLNHIPGIHENYRYFLALMPLAAMLLRIRHKADIVISSSHCVIKAVKKPRGSKHFCYIHSPMRYIYDQFDNYFGNSSLPVKVVASMIRPYLQWFDRATNKNVDVFMANSEFVKERVTRYYGREAEVVYPFVDLKDFLSIQKSLPPKDDYYLMVTAFAPNKRVDLAIETFNELNLSLKIIGSGADEMISKLKKMSGPSIEFLGNVDRESVVQYMAKAKAFIFPGVEDFGITPLESMASGTPVIAYKKGGALETLTPKTAEFFDFPTKKDLTLAVGRLSTKKPDDLIARANDFSKQRFISHIQRVISNHE